MLLESISTCTQVHVPTCSSQISTDFNIWTLTYLAATVPQVLRVRVAGIDAHAVGVDLGEEALVVRDEVGGAGGGQSQRQRLAERAHLAVALCDKPAKSYCLMPQ